MKLKKEHCEICGESNKTLLQFHHIIERVEINGTPNDPLNIAIICSHCHIKSHSGEIEIVGIYPSTAKNGRTLIYKKDGKYNVEGITEAYFQPKEKAMKIPIKK